MTSSRADTRPRVELLVAPRTGNRILPLVQVLSRWWDPTAPDPALGPPVAILASSPAARGLDERLSGSAPVIVWVDGPHETIDLLPAPPTVVLTPSPIVDLEGVTTILVPVPGIDTAEHRVVPPFVRERWRRRFDLPPGLVISTGFPSSPSLDDDALSTALALAAAVAARGDITLRAMALGAPVATDAATARRLGLTDGVVVADDPEQAAADLATDLTAAASLSRRARAEVVARHDLAAIAEALLDQVAAQQVAAAPATASSLNDRLRELGTPMYSLPAQRAATAALQLAES